jgi:CBS domain-containing protein
MKVEQIMTRDVLAVAPDTPLKNVAALFAERRIRGVPVVENGEVVGVVSEVDILFKERGEERSTRRLGWVLHPERIAEDLKLDARTAREAMTWPAVTIEEGAPVWTAASTMLEHGVSRLPVLDRDGRLVGIVTSSDLVRAFLRPDEEIEREIRDELMARAFSIPSGTVTARVTRGEVSLTGFVETADLASALPEAVRRVPGVVTVRSELSHGKDETRSTFPWLTPNA